MVNVIYQSWNTEKSMIWEKIGLPKGRGIGTRGEKVVLFTFCMGIVRVHACLPRSMNFNSVFGFKLVP